MKFENLKVMNFEGAFRGLRNPKNSWNRSDSFFGLVNSDYAEDGKDLEVAKTWVNEIPLGADDIEEKRKLLEFYNQWLLNNGIINKNEETGCYEIAFIGANDMKLAQTLIRAGSEHRKFLRQIFVSIDITAPLYW